MTGMNAWWAVSPVQRVTHASTNSHPGRDFIPW
jgi:hypothetical protein